MLPGTLIRYKVMSTNNDILDIYRIFISLKRGYKIILISMGVFLGLAFLYLLITPSQYTAKASILLDRSQADTVAALSSTKSSSFENAAIESQVEIIKSRRIIEQAMQYLYSESEMEALKNDFKVHEATLSQLIKGLRANREGETHVITLRYTHTDPKIAADRANAFAEAYIYDQVNYFSEGSVKTATWLENKIEALRQKSIESASAVQEFRIKYDLIDNNGQTINEQRIQSVNAKLGDARARADAAHVRYMHSKNIIEKNDISAAVAEAFNNDVINSIRAKYLENQARLTRLIATLGQDHVAVKNQKKVLEESRNVIFGEMKRIVQSNQNDFEVAKAEAESLEKTLNELITLKIKNDSFKFELEALEKEAQTHQNLYDDYLEKFQMVNQQQSFPVSQSRIITYAMPPQGKSHPKSFLILGLALILGTGVGVFLALLKDNFDKTIKRAGQVESELGLFFLGFLPKFEQNNPSAKVVAGDCLFKNREFSNSVSSARSLHADTSHNIQLVVDKKLGCDSGRVIGVASDTPGSGKSITASNLALYIAQSGASCLLIDADIRNPMLSGANRIKRSSAVEDVRINTLPLGEHIAQDQKTGLYVLPTHVINQITEQEIQSLVRDARTQFDYVILDLPPLSASSDTARYIDDIDGFILALEWGETKANSLKFHLKQSGIQNKTIIGVVISQTDMTEMAQNYSHRVYPEYVSVS